MLFFLLHFLVLSVAAAAAPNKRILWEPKEKIEISTDYTISAEYPYRAMTEFAAKNRKADKYFSWKEYFAAIYSNSLNNRLVDSAVRLDLKDVVTLSTKIHRFCDEKSRKYYKLFVKKEFQQLWPMIGSAQYEMISSILFIKQFLNEEKGSLISLLEFMMYLLKKALANMSLVLRDSFKFDVFRDSAAKLDDIMALVNGLKNTELFTVEYFSSYSIVMIECIQYLCLKFTFPTAALEIIDSLCNFRLVMHPLCEIGSYSMIAKYPTALIDPNNFKIESYFAYDLQLKPFNLITADSFYLLFSPKENSLSLIESNNFETCLSAAINQIELSFDTLFGTLTADEIPTFTNMIKEESLIIYSFLSILKRENIEFLDYLKITVELYFILNEVVFKFVDDFRQSASFSPLFETPLKLLKQSYIYATNVKVVALRRYLRLLRCSLEPFKKEFSNSMLIFDYLLTLESIIWMLLISSSFMSKNLLNPAPPFICKKIKISGNVGKIKSIKKFKNSMSFNRLKNAILSISICSTNRMEAKKELSIATGKQISLATLKKVKKLEQSIRAWSLESADSFNSMYFVHNLSPNSHVVFPLSTFKLLIRLLKKSIDPSAHVNMSWRNLIEIAECFPSFSKVTLVENCLHEIRIQAMDKSYFTFFIDSEFLDVDVTHLRLKEFCRGINIVLGINETSLFSLYQSKNTSEEFETIENPIFASSSDDSLTFVHPAPPTGAVFNAIMNHYSNTAIQLKRNTRPIIQSLYWEISIARSEREFPDNLADFNVLDFYPSNIPDYLAVFQFLSPKIASQDILRLWRLFNYDLGPTLLSACGEKCGLALMKTNLQSLTLQMKKSIKSAVAAKDAQFVEVYVQLFALSKVLDQLQDEKRNDFDVARIFHAFLLKVSVMNSKVSGNFFYKMTRLFDKAKLPAGCDLKKFISLLDAKQMAFPGSDDEANFYIRDRLCVETAHLLSQITDSISSENKSYKAALDFEAKHFLQNSLLEPVEDEIPFPCCMDFRGLSAESIEHSAAAEKEFQSIMKSPVSEFISHRFLYSNFFTGPISTTKFEKCDYFAHCIELLRAPILLPLDSLHEVDVFICSVSIYFTFIASILKRRSFISEQLLCNDLSNMIKIASLLIQRHNEFVFPASFASVLTFRFTVANALKLKAFMSAYLTQPSRYLEQRYGSSLKILLEITLSINLMQSLLEVEPGVKEKISIFPAIMNFVIENGLDFPLESLDKFGPEQWRTISGKTIDVPNVHLESVDLSKYFIVSSSRASLTIKEFCLMASSEKIAIKSINGVFIDLTSDSAGSFCRFFSCLFSIKNTTAIFTQSDAAVILSTLQIPLRHYSLFSVSNVLFTDGKDSLHFTLLMDSVNLNLGPVAASELTVLKLQQLFKFLTISSEKSVFFFPSTLA